MLLCNRMDYLVPDARDLISYKKILKSPTTYLINLMYCFRLKLPRAFIHCEIIKQTRGFHLITIGLTGENKHISNSFTFS